MLGNAKQMLYIITSTLFKMGRIKDEIKQELREQVEDIVYEKAKEEIKGRIKDKYESVLDKTLSFLGIRETKRQKITKITEEIKESKSLVLSDQMLGMIELFTLNYANSLVDIMASTLNSAPEKKNEEKIGIWKP